MENRYRIIASVLLLAALVSAALFQLGAVPLFTWVQSQQYLEGLARFLAGTLSALLVVFLLFPLVGEPQYMLQTRKLDQVLTLDPPPENEWAIDLIQEQERHLRWLAWRLAARNLLLALFGGLIAAAVADWWGGAALTVACLLGLGWGGVFGLAGGLWRWRHPLLVEEECPLPGVPPLSDLDGAREEHRQGLRELGILTAADLLQAGAKPKGRKDLAGRLGITAPLVEQFVIEAELLANVAGLNEEYAGLLYRANVRGVADLAQRDPERLAALLRERFDAEVEHYEDPPQLFMVENWISQARQARPVIRYK